MYRLKSKSNYRLDLTVNYKSKKKTKTLLLGEETQTELVTDKMLNLEKLGLVGIYKLEDKPKKTRRSRPAKTKKELSLEDSSTSSEDVKVEQKETEEEKEVIKENKDEAKEN